MRKYNIIFALIVLLITQQSFAANVTSDSDDLALKQCETIAHACLGAGFAGKGFWRDCMKPVLLGQTVKGVNIDSNDVISCRQFKITKMQKELEQFQQIQPTQTQTK